MKRLFTLILLGLGFAVTAQITVSPASLEAVFSEKEKLEIPLTVTNTTQDSYDVYWKLVKSDDIPSQWETTICDDNLCYLPNTDECPSNKPNIFLGETSSTAWSFKLDPKKVKGSATFHLEFYSDSGFTNKIGSTTEFAVITADSDMTTSTSFLQNDQNIAIFPNPTPNYFFVRNDANVATVSVINIIGKELWTKKHIRGTQYDVSDLNKGVYLVRLFNQNHQLIKTIRLNKSVL